MHPGARLLLDAAPSEAFVFRLPNDVEVRIAKDGTVGIDDGQQKVLYEAAPRGFNKYLNASDVIEDFIRYLGKMNVRQGHVMKMPLGLFINWLVIESARADGDAADDLLPKLQTGVHEIKRPTCLYCRRFISKSRHDRGVNFCSGSHLDRYTARPLVPFRKQQLLPPSATYFKVAA